ncbi:unnamed protein product [Cochlearia groenlandica]
MAFFENIGNFIAGTFTRPHVVNEEEKALNDLQRSDGSRFPGEGYRPSDPSDRKNWMASLSATGRLTINKIVWPGTHNSATNRIKDHVIGVIGSLLGECQTLSIYEQLVRGTRVLDIRVQEDLRICHGPLLHCHVDDVLNDVLRFLSETRSEIVILEIRTEYGYKDPPGFESYLVNKLNPYLIQQSDDLFHKTVSKILPKRVICIWKPRNTPKPRLGGLLWNSDYLRDDWVNTDLPLTKFNKNIENLSGLPPVSSRYFFYRTENTLTPQTDNLVLDVKSVTCRIRNHARLFISQCISKGHGDKLQILSSDFIEDDFIDACIGLTDARFKGTTGIVGRAGSTSDSSPSSSSSQLQIPPHQILDHPPPPPSSSTSFSSFSFRPCGRQVIEI